MIAKNIKVTETKKINREFEPLCFGVPFAVSELLEPVQLQIYDGDKILPSQFKKLAVWNDGSIKWLLVETQISLLASHTANLQLRLSNNNVSDDNSGITYIEFENEFVVNCQDQKFYLSKSNGLPLAESVANSASSFELKLVVGKQEYLAVIKHIDRPRQCSPVSATFKFSGEFGNDSKVSGIKFSLIITFFMQGSLMKIECDLHNSLAAEHLHGKWDLGDKYSFYFKQFALHWKDESHQKQIQECKDGPWLDIAVDNHFVCYQGSSGGEYWNSPNHQNYTGKVALKFRGFERTNSKNSVTRGQRAEPILLVQGQNTNQFYLQYFWQNFPSAMTTNKHGLLIKLFPEESNQPFELQPGERKNQIVYFTNAASLNALSWCRSPLVVHLDKQHYCQSKVIPWLGKTEEIEVLQSLFEEGIAGENDFFTKREVIDEYGWRNFGEVFADHEAVYQQEKASFISHYNNQYDAIYGFAKQFLLYQNENWYILMDELAKHVVDIDIYHTKNDRAEYNGGLFWHTDHYLPANRATHRTFSRDHNTDQNKSSGGGPGSEHCYTSGLLLHYYLTGNEKSKAAVESLVSWMINIEEGNGTISERLFAFFKSDIANIKKLLTRKKILNFRYPFTRGTGNYITTLLDAFQLSSDKRYLELCERVIDQMLGPLDNIDDRNLADIEGSWSYLVALQAVAQYLDVKESLGQTSDQSYLYARASFIHYCDWICRNEQPFLESCEVLEYPNDTWIAQDLRKANLLFIAAKYSGNEKTELLARARYFYHYVVSNLHQSEQKSLSRILILLLQNASPLAPLPAENKFASTDVQKHTFKSTEYLTVSKILWALFADLLQCLKNFSLKKEFFWLKTKLNNNNKNVER